MSTILPPLFPSTQVSKQTIKHASIPNLVVDDFTWASQLLEKEILEESDFMDGFLFLQVI